MRRTFQGDNRKIFVFVADDDIKNRQKGRAKAKTQKDANIEI